MELLEAARKIFGSDLVAEVIGDAEITTSGDIDFSHDKGGDGEIIIKFTNGKIVQFRTSEWAWIESLNFPSNPYR